MAHGSTPLADGRLADNRIPEGDHSFALNVGTWYSADATLAIEYNDVISESDNTLKISPTTLGPVQVSFSPVRTNLLDRNDSMVFHCRVKCENDILVQTVLSRQSEAQVTRSEAIASSRWTIVRSEPLPIPFTSETYLIYTTLTFTNHGGKPIFLTLPVLHRDFAFTDNLFVREMVPIIPEVFTAIDREQKYPSFPMYRLLEVGLAYAGVAFDQWDHYKYKDIADGRIDSDPFTLSGLVDGEVADRRFLPWLAQFNGVPLLDPVIGTTPWGNLPGTWSGIMQSIDPTTDVVLTIDSINRSSNVVTAVVLESLGSLSAGDVVSVSLAGSFNGQFQVTDVDLGTSTITWDQEGTDESASAGRITVVDTEWIEIEAFQTDITGVEEYLRWQVDNGYYGTNAGTKQSIIEATKQVLNGTKTVNVYQNWEGNPWRIKIYTRTSETPEGVDGASSSKVLEAVERARPAGFEIIHESNPNAADSVFILGDPVNGVLGVSRL